MIFFGLLFFGFRMSGSVDQINDNLAEVELTAKDGHAHDVTLPVWMFPCEVKEGLQFHIEFHEKNTTIRCDI